MMTAAGAGTKKINDPKRIFCEVRHDFYQLLPFSEIKRGTLGMILYLISILIKTTLVRLITRFG